MRTSTCTALVLRVRPVGENREASLLTDGEGLLRVTVFGGPKSRLRAYAAPFNQGTAWIYHDPVRDSRKLTDFDVRQWRPGLREIYDRTMAADAAAATVLASHGGGGAWPRALALASGALDALENAEAADCPRLFTRFLWNWADFLGARPGMESCAHCGRQAGSEEALYYAGSEAALLCAECRRGGADSGGFIQVGPEARRWLEYAGPLDAAAQKQARALAQAVVAAALGQTLPAWENV